MFGIKRYENLMMRIFAMKKANSFVELYIKTIEPNQFRAIYTPTEFIERFSKDVQYFYKDEHYLNEEVRENLSKSIEQKIDPKYKYPLDKASQTKFMQSVNKILIDPF